ncbi:hypothetical protein L6452_02518 [Arctium lappa]|uniref:Uncharacterized protein n=1 Tax=Arctium lappa TaxID=4217 RepID=A0ACB9FKL9_ARCLA|nr:hypothetical protein L6452_02518 [Arctium lappa]
MHCLLIILTWTLRTRRLIQELADLFKNSQDSYQELAEDQDFVVVERIRRKPQEFVGIIRFRIVISEKFLRTEFAVLYTTKSKEFVIESVANFIEFAEMTSREALAIGTDTKRPVLFKGEYEQWKDRFMDFIERHELGELIKKSLTEGIMAIPMKTRTVGGEQREYPLPLDEFTEEQLKRRNADRLAKTYILQGIPNEIYVKIDSYKAIGKEIWDQVEKMMLRQSNKVNKSQIELNVKFLSILQPEWKRFTRQMKQMKDLNEIPLHEVYETLWQNEEEVDEIKAEKKKDDKAVADPIALVVKKKSVSLKKKKKVIISKSEEAESEDNSDSEDCEDLKQAMLMLTKAFQKKFYKKPSSNSQRYSSGSRNYEHKEKVEGKRIEEKRSDEKPYKAEEKKQPESTKCYNCDEEVEKEEIAHICLMGNIVNEAEDKAESDEEEKEEVCDMTESDFLNQMHAMMVKLQELESKLKREKSVIKDKNQSIQKLSNDIAEKNVLIEALHKNIDTSAKEKTIIHKELFETVSKYRLCEFESKELNKMYSSLSKENRSLLEKVHVLEGKLYTLGQTEQTIYLNKPKENKECWGLGYENPHYLKKGITEVSALYDFGFLKLAPQYPELRVEWTKLSEEDEAKEFEKRKNTAKVQLPFRYERLNNSYSSDNSKFLSNDYFESYSLKEMEAKPIEVTPESLRLSVVMTVDEATTWPVFIVGMMLAMTGLPPDPCSPIAGSTLGVPIRSLRLLTDKDVAICVLGITKDKIDYVLRPQEKLKHLFVEKEMSYWWGLKQELDELVACFNDVHERIVKQK